MKHYIILLYIIYVYNKNILILKLNYLIIYIYIYFYIDRVLVNILFYILCTTYNLKYKYIYSRYICVYIM